MADSKPAETFGGCVKNDKGQLLPYTMASTMSQCEDRAKQLWPNGLWDKLQALGCKIVHVEIKEIPGCLDWATLNERNKSGNG